MNNQSKRVGDKFKIILSVGDDSGVGPEIILKALFSKEIPSNLDYIIVGSKNNLKNTLLHDLILIRQLFNPAL